MEKKLLTLPEHQNSPPLWSGVRVILSLVLCVMFCRSLFVLLSVFFWPLCYLSFFFWPLCYLSFFDLRILISFKLFLRPILMLTIIHQSKHEISIRKRFVHIINLQTHLNIFSHYLYQHPNIQIIHETHYL